jgi:hypothetical protein
VKRSLVLCLEELESRCTPATWGNPWPDPTHLTVSFAPDGTQINGQSSNLFSLLNSKVQTSTWEQAILRAAQTWAVNANINLGVVTDGGQDFGTAGALQGDSRFGDIRIGAIALPPSQELAIASPFETLAGTWSGDIRLSNAVNWGIGGKGQYDLYTVMLHEFGHSLGLPDSSDPTSVMYDDYIGPRTGLSSTDIGNLQALYGARAPDPSSNNSLATATPLSPLTNSTLSGVLVANADIATLQVQDVYSFTTLLTTGSVDINVQTGGLSLLTPEVTVYNASGQVVSSAVASSPLSGGVQLQFNGVLPLSRYYVKIESGSQDVFGIGSYQLQVETIPAVNSLLGGLSGTVTGLGNTVLTVVDTTTNDTFLTASLLAPLNQPTGSNLNYTYHGTISFSGDTDYYKVTAPPSTSSAIGALTVMTWGLPTYGLLGSNGTAPPAPRVQVFDAQQDPISSAVLINDGFSYAVQIVNPVPSAVYYVKVTGAPTPQGPAQGSYDVSIDFSPHPVHLHNLASGTIPANTGEVDSTLNNNVGQMFHFVLASQGGAVAMTITDQKGNVLFSLSSSGEAVSENVFLKAGSYRVRFIGTPSSTSTPLSFLLQGQVITDPDGPAAYDPTAAPSGDSTTPASDTYTWDGTTYDDTTAGASSDPSTQVGSGSSGSSTDPNSTNTTTTPS